MISFQIQATINLQLPVVATFQVPGHKSHIVLSDFYPSLSFQLNNRLYLDQMHVHLSLRPTGLSVPYVYALGVLSMKGTPRLYEAP